MTRPTLKSDAERVVSRIEGVSKVVNNVEVLPLSPFDDRIRLATYPIDLWIWSAVPIQLGAGTADSHYREERKCDFGRCRSERNGSEHREHPRQWRVGSVLGGQQSSDRTG